MIIPHKRSVINILVIRFTPKSDHTPLALSILDSRHEKALMTLFVEYNSKYNWYESIGE